MECVNEIGESAAEVHLVEWYSSFESYLMEMKTGSHSTASLKWITCQIDQRDHMAWYKVELLNSVGFDWNFSVDQLLKLKEK